MTDLTTLPTISASKLKEFKKCPRKYYNHYIKKIPQDENISGIWGKSLHVAIESYHRNRSVPRISFQDSMRHQIEDYQEKNVTIRGIEYYTRFIKLGKEILENIKWDEFQPGYRDGEQLLEVYFTFPFPAVDPICIIEGYIDHIDDRGFIVDYKSGKEKPSQLMLDNDVQFLIYYWAYIQEYNEAPIIYWYHLRTQEWYRAYVENEYEHKVEQLEKDIRALLEVEKFQRKEHDSWCEKFCSYVNLCFK